MNDRQTIMQLKREIEGTTLWSLRHHLNVSAQCPFRVAWLYPVGLGATPDAWVFRHVGAGLSPIELPAGDYLVKAGSPKFQAQVGNHSFYAPWSQGRQHFCALRLTAHKMPRLMTPFTLKGNDHETLHGIIYSAPDRMEPTQQGSGKCAA